MKKKYIYYWIFIVLALVSAIILYNGVSKLIEKEEIAKKNALLKANEVAATELNVMLLNYATLLSGIKTYIKSNQEVPAKEQLKEFIRNQLVDLSMDPPFSISYVDSNHIIQYDILFTEEEKIDLSGKPLVEIIGELGVLRMDTLMQKNEFYASHPTNLLEGEVGLPLGFGVLDGNNKSIGYISSVALFKPIVEKVYNVIDKDKFALSFQSSNGNYFDRTRSHNKQISYADAEDPEYFKNFDIPEAHYVYSEVPFYNRKYTIGTAYKMEEESSLSVLILSSLWYIVLIGFMLFVLTRFYFYQKKNEIIIAQKQSLTEMVETKNKFFSIIANDLRNPLMSTVNFLDLIKEDAISGEANQQIATAIGDSSKSSISLIDNLLKWSRIQSGTITFNPSSINLLKIATDQIRLLEAQAKHKNLRIDLECSFDKNISADKNMIAFVTRNFLTNALKFSKPYNVIVVDISQEGEYASLSVEDNGIGIPERSLHMLFDVTEATTQTGTASEKGSGMGLILSKEYISMHNGKLFLESAVNKGTIATFQIPRS